MKTTVSFSKHIKAKSKIVVSQGGSNSAKSYSIMEIFVFIATSKPNTVLSVVMADVPTLKRGVIRDFKNIMGTSLEDKRWNGTDRVYSFPNGSIIEFFGAENSNKLKVGKRDYCWIDECNNVANGYSAFSQLNIRTEKRMYLTNCGLPEICSVFLARYSRRFGTSINLVIGTNFPSSLLHV